MEISETNKDGVTVVEPRGRIDTAGAEPFGKRIVELIRSGARQVLIDFRDVQYISSAGFRALLIARKLIDETGGRLVLCGMSPEIKRVFAIGAFTDLFIICATREDGIAKSK